MNLRDLEYICAVADLGHFGQAATRCHVSQPTLSGQIRKLEDHLGVELFERTNRTVRLTPVGERIVTVARAVLASAREIEQIAESERDPESGTIRLGMIPTIAPYLIPILMGPLQERFPSLRLVLVEDTTDALLAALAAGDLEASVIATRPDDPSLVVLPLYREPFWFALPEKHPRAKSRRVHASGLDPSELLLLTDGHCLRDQALDVCGATAGSHRADTAATSLETLVNLVAAGHGITLVPSLALGVAKRAQRVVVRPADTPDAERLVRLVHRPSFPYAALLRRLAAVARDALPREVNPVR